MLSPDFRTGLAATRQDALKANPNHWYGTWLTQTIIPHAPTIAVGIVAIHARVDELAGRQWEALLARQHEQVALLRRLDALTAEIHRATARP